MASPARRALRRPPRLRVGDRVTVVAPSGPVDPDLLDGGLAVLRDLGLTATLGGHVLDRQGYLAGRDQDRAADLQRAWLDPRVAGVVCARGGYGTARVLDHLDWTAMAAGQPKVLLGGSDVTALHEAFAVRLGVATLFGPMPATVLLGDGTPDPGSVTHLRDTLFTPEAARVIGGTGTSTDTSAGASAGTEAVVGGRARGVTCGGTLTLLAAAAGTPDLLPASGGIALLEDVGEEPYRIDRMLTQLLRAGWFDGVAAVALGSWLRCGDGALDVLAERLAPLRVPVLAGLPFGHGRPQLTVPLGVPAELDADAGLLTFDVPALR